MTPQVRQAKIANIIRKKKQATVNELAEILNISRETIRRDLSALAKTGKVQKFHGGASLPMTTEEGPFNQRMGDNVTEKIQVASAAAQLISPGETVLIDSGSTALYFAEKMAEIPALTVVTNSADIARIISLSPGKSRAFLLGGEFAGDNRQTLGNFAISQVRLFRAHHAVLTISALDVHTGVMDYAIEEAQIAQAMIEQAESLTIIADHSKFDRIASFKVCGLERITNLICDKYPENKLLRALEDAHVNIISVNADKK
ncbi:MAG: DeoR/GlpR family DNA-binding transcription regulator [Desulfobacterales bacterium]|nr:DeoR/GlpR family DNA-binding transcription regulator [Desulfobacterales bacterium]